MAIVTGAAQGLGRVISEALAEAGVRVALVGKTVESVKPVAAAIARPGGIALAIGADVTDAKSVEEVATTVEKELGAVDLLVNNAGRYRALGPIWEADAGNWWGDIEGNIRGTFLCLRYVLPGMVSRGSGRVVNLASAAASGPRPYGSAYAAAKAAVIQLTESVAVSVREHGIQAFSLHPGPVATSMSAFLVESEAGRMWMPEYQDVYRNEALDPRRAADLIVRIARGDLDRLTGCFLDARDIEAGLASLGDHRLPDAYSLRIMKA